MSVNKPTVVRINKDGNTYKLRWSVGGRRFSLGTGIRVDDQPRFVYVQQLARQIELDILTGVFDTTLAKYTNNEIIASKDGTPKLAQHNLQTLLQEFLDWKGKQVKPKSLEHWSNALKLLDPVAHKQVLTLSDVDSVVLELSALPLADSTKHRKLEYINSTLNWLVKRGKLSHNPFAEAKLHLTKGSKTPKPFSTSEVVKILAALEGNPYKPFIVFLLNTGLRIGEASGLRWGDVSKNYSTVTVQRSLTKRKIINVKTGRERLIALNLAARHLLTTLPRKGASEYVFTTPSGATINADNFRARVWKPLLKQLGIPYRPPYNCRATFVSHVLESGMSPLDASSITGHSTQTMYKHYAATVHKPKPPDNLF